ncbi:MULTISPECIES: hypothetical protein [Methanobacterium]|uniref:Uncharacterized protein n=1 Tax=Methanobacterium bryantii TaxID=2161 RepID=A0A2A2H8X2_METBR|nr:MULTISPECIES: hypothetical protein [Methanobacterium]OEC87857.1 hypothetical protein A9507_06695 [Methanobacterium sp. A39]PAV05724.1 hypothetical protein ASJ80_08305 [Methanobacterium bryantii]
MSYMYRCNNCRDTTEDESKPSELSESDKLCSNCYCGYYQLVGTVGRRSKLLGNTAILHII